jgi:tetratricopeptide (TPR) repeat protein
MAARVIVFAISCCLATAAAWNPPSQSSNGQRDQAQRLTLDGVLAAYLDGDLDVVSRSFGKARDFPEQLRLNSPKELERWLGSWDRRKALLLLEIARATGQVSPRFPPVVVDAGKRYVLTAGLGDLTTPETAASVHLWHRIAAALLQKWATSLHVEAYAREVALRTGAPLDARLALARAVARERTCWDTRPALSQLDVESDVLTRAAGVKVRSELDGLPAFRETRVVAHKTCLEDALVRFEAVISMDDAREEARVRGGWILFQLERFHEAVEWLDSAAPKNDRELEYWSMLIRGRVLESLADRSQDALSAYRAAQALYPGAQSAAVGQAIVLTRLGRAPEADTIARALRVTATDDPWLIYPAGDHRFVDRWIDQLRTAWR